MMYYVGSIVLAVGSVNCYNVKLDTFVFCICCPEAFLFNQDIMI